VRGFLRDLRYGTRRLAAKPASTAVVVLSLAIAIGPNCLLFTVLDGIFFRPVEGLHIERMQRLFFQISEDAYEAIGYPDYTFIQQNASAFSDVIAYYPEVAWLTIGGTRERLPFDAVSDNYFAALGVRAMLGRTLSGPQEAGTPENAVVVSHRLWARRFGSDPNVIGKSLTLNGRPFTIVGVAMPQFVGLELQVPVDAWVSLQAMRLLYAGGFVALHRSGREGLFLYVDVRLRKGVTLEQALTQANAIVTEFRARDPGSHQARRAVMSSLVGDARSMMTVSAVVLGLANVVLLVACANIAALLAADAESRRRDFALRAALGAAPRHLIRQSLAESLLLALLGTAAGVVLTRGLVTLIPTLVPRTGVPLNYDIFVGGGTLGYSAFVCLLTVAAFGLWPAMKASRPALVPALTGAADFESGAARRIFSRKWLVMGEIAAVQFLLTGAALLFQSYRLSQNIHMGVDPSRNLLVLWVSVEPGVGGGAPTVHYRHLLDQLRGLPSVKAATSSAFLPLSGIGDGASTRVMLPGSGSREEGLSVFCARVGPEYFRILGTRVLRGSEFEWATGQPRSGIALVNETLARRLWGGQDPIGKVLRSDSGDREIVGVVEDGKYSSIYEEPRPAIFFPVGLDSDSAGLLIIETVGGPTPLIPAIRREIASAAPNLQVVSMTTMKQFMQFAMFLPRTVLNLVGSLALLAISLAGVGLYAVAVGSIRRRSYEIAVRLAVGAQQQDILRLVLREAMTSLAVGIAVGSALSLAASKLMSFVLYRVSPMDPVTLLLSALGVTLISGFATMIPAQRALRVDLVRLLRHE
jgi:predicted permease